MRIALTALILSVATAVPAFAQETIKGVTGLVYGQLLGGTAGTAAGIPNFDPFSRTGDAATAGADEVGAWVDGRSETFPP